MEQSAIEKQMSKRAIARFDNDIRSLAKLIYANPVGRRIIIGDKKLSCNSSSGVFTDIGIRNPDSISNYKKVREELIQEYEVQEMQDILTKLDSIQYLFNQD